MTDRRQELISAIRAHPHFALMLEQFRYDADEGLADEDYPGESADRTMLWQLLYELLAGEPML